jgi:hypothetical protein
MLAVRDAAGAVATDGVDGPTAARARRAAGRIAHLLVLRHAFAAAEFAALTRPWRPRFLADQPAGPRVRRPGHG